MNVVTSAITTSIENSAGEMMPRSRPEVEHDQFHQPACVHQHAEADGVTRRQARHPCRQGRPEQLADDGQRQDEAAVEPHRSAGHEADLRPQPCECEEDRQQQRRRHELEPGSDGRDERLALGQHHADEEGAEQQVQAQPLGEHGRHHHHGEQDRDRVLGERAAPVVAGEKDAQSEPAQERDRPDERTKAREHPRDRECMVRDPYQRHDARQQAPRRDVVHRRACDGDGADAACPAVVVRAGCVRARETP